MDRPKTNTDESRNKNPAHTHTHTDQKRFRLKWTLQQRDEEEKNTELWSENVVHIFATYFALTWFRSVLFLIAVCKRIEQKNNQRRSQSIIERETQREIRWAFSCELIDPRHQVNANENGQHNNERKRPNQWAMRAYSYVRYVYILYRVSTSRQICIRNSWIEAKQKQRRRRSTHSNRFWRIAFR